MPSHHEFTDDEVDQMLYAWDADQASVQEYFYLKDEWKESTQDETEDASLSPFPPNQARSEVAHQQQNEELPDADRTSRSRTKVKVDDSNSNSGNASEDAVFLDLDTTNTVHVVEFYSPWCPHCIHMREAYIEIAAEVSRRVIGVNVAFHAVSCQLFPAICRAYSIGGYPMIFGYRIGSNIQHRGIELNPESETDDAPDFSAQSIANDLDLTLAETEMQHALPNLTDPIERMAWERDQQQLAEQSIETRQAWHHSPSTLDDRYHDAAVSLIFLLEHGVFTSTAQSLTDPQADALKDFLEVVEWATPQSWHVRTNLVQDVLANLTMIQHDRQALMNIVDQYSSAGTARIEADGPLWGSLSVSQFGKHQFTAASSSSSRKVARSRNLKWTQSCTHQQRGMGYTCGLWNLFHIITIGSSLPSHQLYAYHSGYLASPVDVAETLRRFVLHFFGCDACRRNFLANMDACGQDHCTRLSTLAPMLLVSGNPTGRTGEDPHQAMALWVMEMHNAVNRRLMREKAQRQGRNATLEEQRSSVFPTRQLCSDCWLDGDMTKYDAQRMFDFLTSRYWPNQEASHDAFQLVLRRRQIIKELASTDDGASSVEENAALSARFRRHMISAGTSRSCVAIICALVLLAIAARAAQGRRRRSYHAKTV